MSVTAVLNIQMPNNVNQKIVFIAGPTASGKSAAALALAKETGGEIVNADAMQVYRDLRILTARPSQADEAQIPHHLYGHVDGAEAYSAGRWASSAAAAIAEICERGSHVIVTGGTGLYFRALSEGFSPIPETPNAIRAMAIERRAAIGPSAFRNEVLSRDPAMEHLPEGDSQRLMRAWEVFEATGRPLSYFQQLPRQPLLDAQTDKILITPPREALYARCDARAENMLDEGALEEVERLLARRLDPAMPVMKALGVPEIMGFMSGAATREETLATLQQNTRRFAKRQLTWFRNQTPDWAQVETAEEAQRALRAQ